MSNGWNMVDSNVVCRQLGFDHAASYYTISSSPGSSNVVMSDVTCQGYELKLADCTRHDWNVDRCTHSADVGVVCSAGKQFVRRLCTPV